MQRFHVGTRLSEMAIFNKTVYLAGQVPENTTQDIVIQTKDVLAQIDRLLEQANSDKSRILMCQIFITDMQNMAGMNQVWDAWIADLAMTNAPPRATVQAALAKPEWLIEIVVTAAQK